MKKNRCKNCKFWDANKMFRKEFMTCISPKFIKGYSHSIGDKDVSNDSVIIESDEGWSIEIGPDFGCIHFEEKGELK